MTPSNHDQDAGLIRGVSKSGTGTMPMRRCCNSGMGVPPMRREGVSPSCRGLESNEGFLPSLFAPPTRTGAGSRHAPGGFTLVEIIVVAVVAAVIAAAIVPRALDGSDMDSLAAAKTMAADLEYARDLSITGGAPITVTFDVNGDSYRLTNASRDIINPITKATSYVVNYRSSRSLSLIDIVSADFSGLSSVTFDPTGAPDHAGTVTIQLKSHVYKVTVANDTGKVMATGS